MKIDRVVKCVNLVLFSLKIFQLIYLLFGVKIERNTDAKEKEFNVFFLILKEKHKTAYLEINSKYAVFYIIK